MNSTAIARHRAAVKRVELSKPIRLALQDGLITTQTTVFDYGCGKGDDIRRLAEQGVPCSGWDPVYRSSPERTQADVVNLGYVVNVIEDPAERLNVLQEAWRLGRKLLVVSARLAAESSPGTQRPYEDGYLTRCGTFQKYFEQDELRSWIDQSLSVSSVAASPGTFYIFRDLQLKESFLAGRYRRSASLPQQHLSELLFRQHKTLLEPLIQFIAARGRLPDVSELPEAPAICDTLGNLQRAFKLICKVTGDGYWSRVTAERSQDLLIYLALARFSQRPRYSQLPIDIQFDVRAFFSTYANACANADALLFSVGDLNCVSKACSTATIGKETPNALYIDTTALQQLPPILRVYEGCARACMGTIPGANVVKLHRHKPQISYLFYADFEHDPHPTLTASMVIPLQTFRVKYKDYRFSDNPPLLHRKEELLPRDHPDHDKLVRLTRTEERHGLYEFPESIGTRDAWHRLLSEKGLRLVGHRLVRTATVIGQGATARS